MKKTTLSIEVEYDEKKTDPEGMACAMDILMKTALSDPGLIEEYGNPKIGKFYPPRIAEAKTIARRR